MTPEQYDAWYLTPRGSWIGDTEYQALRGMLGPHSGARVIDVGCGTGYFTRRLAVDGLKVTGVDPDPAMLDVARARRAGNEQYLQADARALPFGNGEFDYCISVTALCFIAEEAVALAEMFRVTRSKVALGLLNRHSILYLQKGRRGGAGAYRGAHWHTAREVRGLLSRVACDVPQLEFAVFLPSGRLLARSVEIVLPRRLPFGAFLAVCAGAKSPSTTTA